MNCMDLLIDFITRCMNFIERYSNALVGIGTIITSIITIRVYKKQNKIYKEQNDISREQILLQRNLNQPNFIVYTRVSLDKENEDSIYGNETLYVENVGQKFFDINIENSVFFTLKNQFAPDSSQVVVYIYDYFFGTNTNRRQNIDQVYISHGEGANRKYGDLYNAAIKEDNGLSSQYLLEKVIFVKISYDDIYEDHHEVYYKKSEGHFKRVKSDEYNTLMTTVNSNYKLRYSVNEISYEIMKDLLIKQEV